MKHIIFKSTLNTLLGAITNDEIMPGSEITVYTTSNIQRLIDIVYVRTYPDKIKAQNSNTILWFKEIME